MVWVFGFLVTITLNYFLYATLQLCIVRDLNLMCIQTFRLSRLRTQLHN